MPGASSLKFRDDAFNGAASGMAAGGPWGALIGAGVGTIGSLITGGQQRNALKKQMRLHEQAAAVANQGYASAIGKNNIATGQLLDAFKGVQTTLGNESSKGWQRINENQQAAVADENGMLGKRGLLSSSVAANARRGIYTDTASHLQALDETIGGLSTSLGLQEAQAKAGAYQQGAQLLADRGNTIAALLGKQAAAQGDVQYQFDAKAVGEGVSSLWSVLFPNKGIGATT